MFKFLRKTFLYILAIPLLFTVLGTLSNQVVLYANHDRFPVSANLVKAQELAPDAVLLKDGHIMLDDTHELMTSETHLNLFADVFDFHDEIESIGDLSLELGDWMWGFAPFVFIFAAVTRLNKQD